MCARSAISSSPPAASKKILRLRSAQGWVAAAIAAIALIALGANLPPHGFYSGDSGVKLIAAINARAHPARPLDIDLPTIAGRPAPYLDRFFELHGDHAHALQSSVFPLLTAPFLALAGLRGAYVLPALAFIALPPLLLLIGRAHMPTVPPWLIALVAVAANPVFFYALELWEHVPAIASLAAATAFAGSRPLLAGLAAGAAILLRPEAAWFAAGLVVLTTNWRAYVAGIAAAVTPFAIYNFAHSGNVLGAHVAANLAPLADHWLFARLERTALWLIPSSPMALAGFAVIVVSHVVRLAGVSVRKAQAIALIGALVVAYAAVDQQINRESLWRAWPLATLLIVPDVTARNRLWMPGLVSIGAVILLSTHNGGAQWGPRFLLIASPALIVLACAAAYRAAQRDGEWFRARLALVSLLLFSAVFTTREAYRELRGTKQLYARINDATIAGVPPGAYVVSRVWWFDQVTASLHGRHTVLTVDDDSEERAALAELEAAQITSALLVVSDESGERRSPPQTAGTCFTTTGERRVHERVLRFVSLACATQR